MAEETERLILDIQFDTQEATRNSIELSKTLKELRENQKQLKASGQELTEEYVQNGVEIKRLTAELRTNENQLVKQAAANKAAAGSNNQLKSTLSVLTAQYNALSKEERDNSVAGQVLQRSIKNISDELKTTEGAVGNFQRQVGGYEEAINKASNSLNEMRDRLKELDTIINNTDIGSKRFRDASDEAANLRLAIDQATGKVDEFGNREPKNPVKRTFEDAVVTAGILGSAFTALSGTFEGNEKAQERLAKAAQGVNIALNVANIVKEKGAIIDTLTLAKTTALTAATAAYTAVVGTSTGVLKAFRLALASTGVLLLVGGLIALVTNFDKVKDAVLRFIPGLQAVADFVGKATDAFLDFIGVTDDETDALKNQESEVQKLIKAEQRRLDLATQQFSQRKRLLEAAGKDTRALQIEEEKFFRDQAARQIKFIEANLDLAKQIGKGVFENAKAEIQRLQDEIANRTVEVQAIQIEAGREAAEKAKQANEQRLKDEQEFYDKLRKTIEDRSKEFTALETGAAKQAEEQAKLSTTAIIGTQQELTAVTAEQLEARTLFRLQAAQSNIDVAALEQEGVFLKTQEGLTNLALLESEFGLQRKDIVADYYRFVDEQGDISFEKYLELQSAQATATAESYTSQAEAAAQFGQAVSGIFADSLTETGFDLQNFAKGVTTLLLDTLQKTINAAIAQIIAKEIASKGFAGVATGAALSVGINTAFAVAKAAINKPTPNKFAEGVIGLHGAGTETSDSIPAYLSRGESVIPAWGTRAIQTLYPGFLERFVGSPKFATGVVDFQPSVSPTNDGNTALIDALRSMPPPVVRVTDINKGQRDFAEVRTSTTI